MTTLSFPADTIGYGPRAPQLIFYIGNIPHFEGFTAPAPYRPRRSGEIAFIVAHTSNHWRKVFNVYAKVIWLWLMRNPAQATRLQQLHQAGVRTWQAYRDEILFGEDCAAALIFSGVIHPLAASTTPTWGIVAGKTYGLAQCPAAFALEDHFWRVAAAPLLIAPYPDYRQLSDARIARLVEWLLEPSVSAQPLGS